MSLIKIIAAITTGRGIGGGITPPPVGDVTAPLVVSLNALNTTRIRIGFNETTTPTIAGWTFNNGSNITPSAVDFVSGFLWDFTVAGLAYGQTITAAYNSASGDTKDAANNELATFSGAAVTNSIAAPPATEAPGIWIGIGQSNYGNSLFSDLNSQNSVIWGGVMPKAFILNPYVNASDYVPYQPGVNSMLMNYDVTGFGSEMSFLKAAITDTGANQYFLKFAYGSTALEGNWESPNGTYHPALRTHIATAIAKAKATEKPT